MHQQKRSVTPEELVAGCRNLVSLPESCLKIQQVMEDPNHTREDIASLVMLDPSMCARILRIVNSAYYGLSHKISEISSALGVIGEHDLKNLVLVSSITQTMDKVASSGIDIHKFWETSLMNGVLARQIAARILRHRKEQLFVAGLLLDVGKLIMYANAFRFREEVLSQVVARGEPEYAVELELIGFDHGEVGGVLASFWQFPELLIDTVRNHHHPERPGEYQLECRIVSLADAINEHLSRLEHGEIMDEEALKSLPHWESKGMECVKLSEVIAESQEQFQQVHEALFGS